MSAEFRAAQLEALMTALDLPDEEYAALAAAVAAQSPPEEEAGLIRQFAREWDEEEHPRDKYGQFRYKEESILKEAFKIGKKTIDPNMRTLTRKQVENLIARHEYSETMSMVSKGALSTEYTGLPLSLSQLPDGRFSVHRNLDKQLETEPDPAEQVVEPAAAPGKELSAGDVVEWMMDAGGREYPRKGTVRSLSDGWAKVFVPAESGGGSVVAVAVSQLKETGESRPPFGSRGLELLRDIGNDPSSKNTPLGKAAWNLVDEIDRGNVKMDMATEMFLRNGSPEDVYRMLQSISSEGQAHSGGEMRRAATAWLEENSHLRS